MKQSGTYTLEEFAGNIKCPTLVCRADADHIGVTSPVLYEALKGATKKEYVMFLAAEGAGEHCEGGARSVFNTRMFEFLNAAIPSSKMCCFIRVHRGVVLAFTSLRPKFYKLKPRLRLLETTNFLLELPYGIIQRNNLALSFLNCCPRAGQFSV